MISSGGEGSSAPSATRRAMRAERRSPARSQASATNEEPAAIPPAQKYSGISQVHTGGFIIGPCTSGGGSPVRADRFAASTSPSGGAARVAEPGSSPERNGPRASAQPPPCSSTGAPPRGGRQLAGEPPWPRAGVV